MLQFHFHLYNPKIFHRSNKGTNRRMFVDSIIILNSRKLNLRVHHWGVIIKWNVLENEI